MSHQPHENQTMGRAIAMVTGQSGKVAAVVPQKLHRVAEYIVYFANIRKISIPFMYLSRIEIVLMQYAGSHYQSEPAARKCRLVHLVRNAGSDYCT